ncbi:hypothetical protein INR49_031226 [Caranx melampygus]|nr:hypothetical protein INR49_031226 [Caranx melampygus]
MKTECVCHIIESVPYLYQKQTFCVTLSVLTKAREHLYTIIDLFDTTSHTGKLHPLTEAVVLTNHDGASVVCDRNGHKFICGTMKAQLCKGRKFYPGRAELVQISKARETVKHKDRQQKVPVPEDVKQTGS